MKENNLFERFLFIQTKDLLELNNIFSTRTKFIWTK